MVWALWRRDRYLTPLENATRVLCYPACGLVTVPTELYWLVLSRKTLVIVKPPGTQQRQIKFPLSHFLVLRIILAIVQIVFVTSYASYSGGTIFKTWLVGRIP